MPPDNLNPVEVNTTIVAHHKPRRILWLVLLGLLALVAGGVGYYKQHGTSQSYPAAKTSPAKQVVEATHTYTNTQFGFELSIPESWNGYRVETGTSSIVFLLPSNPAYGDKSGWDPILTLGVYTIAEYNAPPAKFDPTKYPNGFGLPLSQNSTYVFTKSPSITITPGLEQAYSQVGKVLKSFKPLGVATTTDWKTYSNSKYNFEFKYPSDWILRETAGLVVSVTDPATDQGEVHNQFIVDTESCTNKPADTGWKIGFDSYRSICPQGKNIHIALHAVDEKVKPIVAEQIFSTLKFTK